jgi:hypothetical protein
MYVKSCFYIKKNFLSKNEIYFLIENQPNKKKWGEVANKTS